MIKIKKNKVLLVEGNDDLHVVSALCEKYNIPETFDIRDCKGIDTLIKSISVELKTSGLETLGIVIDADTNLGQRWKEISICLMKCGYTSIPVSVAPDGIILKEENKASIGIWLMPDNNDNGMLEDFIKFLIPSDDNLLPIIKNTLDSIQSLGLHK